MFVLFQLVATRLKVIDEVLLADYFYIFQTDVLASHLDRFRGNAEQVH